MYNLIYDVHTERRESEASAVSIDPCDDGSSSDSSDSTPHGKNRLPMPCSMTQRQFVFVSLCVCVCVCFFVHEMELWTSEQLNYDIADVII